LAATSNTTENNGVGAVADQLFSGAFETGDMAHDSRRGGDDEETRQVSHLPWDRPTGLITVEAATHFASPFGSRGFLVSSFAPRKQRQGNVRGAKGDFYFSHDP
jgi:hypothetical protein